MVFTESLLAIAVFIKSIKVLGWQPGAPKSREHDFPKLCPNFLKFIEPLTPLWVLQPSQNMHMFATATLLARAVFTKSIKMLGWQAGAPNHGSMIFRKKNVLFLNFIGPVTTPWVLYPSQNMHMVSAESLLATAVFTKSNKVLG